MMSRLVLASLIVALAPLGAADRVAAQTPPYASSGPHRLPSPEIAPDRSVTFRFHAPAAQTVRLRGDWPGGQALAMARDETGVWSLTTSPLTPDLYTYWFDVDGVRALDPSNAETQRGGDRHASLLIVSGPESRWWDASDVPHGSVETIWHPAPTLGQAQRRMTVYLPAGYHENPARRYPVLYLLHGGGGDEESWIAQGRAPVILDNLIAAGQAEPMIVVMPNGIEATPSAQGSGLGPTPSPQQLTSGPIDMTRFALDRPQPRLPYAGAFSESLVRDIIPFLERTYRVEADARHRAVAGLSLGAAQTVVISTENPETFGYIGVFSGGGLLGDPAFDAKLRALAAARPALFWTGAGDDDISRIRTRALYESARAEGMTATHKQIPGAHVWPIWRDFLADFAPRLFK